MLKMRILVTALALAGSVSAVHAAGSLPKTAPAPADNPTTQEKVVLGQMLYHDPRLSSTGTVSCASCHNTMLGGEDNRPNSMGVNSQTGGRSAPTVWNSAFNQVQFWDGRAASLEEQAAGPVTNPIEMGMKSWDDVVVRLKTIEGYQDAFEKAFGKDSISKDNATKAIAAYERTLITPNSPFDKYVDGDKGALTEQQVRGMKKAVELGCTGCHSGPAFNGAGTFQKFPVNSSGYFEAKYHFKKDKGLAEVTKKAEDEHMWKVPTLRNIALTAPYMHNGSVATLEDAVKLMGKLQLGQDLAKDDIADIVAFLNALTGEFPKQAMPALPGTSGRSFN
ncbi:cytochrome-c peroxidase [Methylicorpusculum sp.]|uniref:cytochrome-c peroxidase n=1 Tax=Methylicorpusculum sp. TaxID=2713644 RepID=UPI002726C853|nr:cytochrome-c peroxidase [Methylicorpusculum sp.]MDO9241335.1 cytochrome-c peroxidase [Methylicorpusculum sp.]MDP2177064.1 cytochrome-c peroxidase [Methylicorpusculum sp.]MDP3531040.1 cytochrome-c peroxidase [Methylicorpusculum sp.]MDZ4153434.1 cytochrome-c peroxidase [Methylicorpusculum sp.]